MSESYAHEHKAGYCRVCELEHDLAAAQAECERLRERLETGAYNNLLNDALNERDALRAHVAELEQDKARLEVRRGYAHPTAGSAEEKP